MKYRLILQLPEASFTYDELEEFENMLIRELKGIAEIDGHDVGANELNYFILTDDANLAFNKIMPLLKVETKRILKAAYRKADSEQYHILYPSDLTTFRIS